MGEPRLRVPCAELDTSPAGWPGCDGAAPTPSMSAAPAPPFVLNSFIVTPTKTAPRIDARRLAAVLPRLLGQDHALPEDWEPEATTYDLPRFYSEAEFVARFVRAVDEILAQDVTEPAELRSLLASCGHPYDYARLGHPLSTIYELYLEAQSGAARAVSFASRTKPFLSVVESRKEPIPLRIYTGGALPLSEAKKRALQAQGVELFEHFSGTIPPGEGLTIYVGSGPYQDGPPREDADASCYTASGGGVLLIRRPELFDTGRIQLIRKRTVAALLSSDAKVELRRLAGLAPGAVRGAQAADCDRLLTQLYPGVTECAYFCTGLAAEAAVFTACAKVLGGDAGMQLFYAQNGYGGTGQLIAEILPREARVVPMPLAVLGRDAQGRPQTLIDRFVAALPDLGAAPACLFLETPTNPELQVHDFPQLMAALHAHFERTGQKVPVFVDTTLAPLYPLFAQDFARDWPLLIVKSGSKYFTKGKATLGVVCGAGEPLSHRILEQARTEARDTDAEAKASQLAALAEGLIDLRPRMARIAASTRRLAELIRTALHRHGHEVTLYSISESQIEAGLATGILSFYLPAAPTDHADLVDEFVDYLLAQAPDLVRNRVSYGQSSGGGRPDVFYVINPQESTQGSLPESVKAAQKRDNVQICRISIPADGDVEALGRVIADFCDRKYAA